MELDEFKVIVKQRTGQTFAQRSVPDLSPVTHNKTRPLIQRIKRSLYLEMTFSVVFTGLIIYIVLNLHNRFFQLWGCIMLVFCTCFIIYLVKLYKQLQHSTSSENSIRENLQRLILILTAFKNLYFQLTMFMVPVCFFTGLAFAYLNRSLLPGSRVPITVNELLIYTGGFAAWALIMYFFTRWYVNKLYGAHLTNLRHHLRDLTNDY